MRSQKTRRFILFTEEIKQDIASNFAEYETNMTIDLVE